MTLKGLLSGFLAKNSSKFTKTKELNTNYIGSIPSRVEYKDIKSALQAEDLGALIRIFEHFKRFDTQISSEFNRRKMQVTRLPLVIDCEDESQKEFLTKFTQTAYFRVFLNELSSGIAYGFASFFENYEAKGGQLLPKYEFISHRYFESDEKLKPYISQGSNKIYLNEKGIFTHLHPTDSGNIIEQSLIYKVVCIAALKHIAISSYMNYLDSLAVPPLIIKSEATQDKELSDLVLKCALDLRSNGVGLFGREDDVAVLNGGVDKETFLAFVRYCDECISKVITGQVLAGNSVQNGTQALGAVHSEIQREACEFDATLLSASVQSILERTLALNFAVPSPLRFELDTNTEKDEKLQADTYAVLANMGVQIPIEHLEKTFKIEGLKYVEKPTYTGLSGFGVNSNQNGVKLNQKSPSLAEGANLKSPPPFAEGANLKSPPPFAEGGLGGGYLNPNAQVDISKTENTTQNTATRLLNKAQSLPANEFERYFNEFKEANADFDFEKFAEIFENSTSFEGAEKALIKAFKGENYPIAEKLLFELGANAELLGYFLQGDKE